jgi:hypothetical protein
MVVPGVKIAYCVFGVGKKNANRDKIQCQDRPTGSCTGQAGATPGQIGPQAGQTDKIGF